MLDTEFVLHAIDEEQKESLLLYHSEKLVVACLWSPCYTQYVLTVILSSNTKREIDIRDVNQFHHFRNGSCS